VRLEFSDTFLLGDESFLVRAPTLLLEADAFGVVAISPRGIHLGDVRQSVQLLRMPMWRRACLLLWERLCGQAMHRAAIEFEHPESVPLQLRLGIPAQEGRITARVMGLRAIHTFRVEPRETIVHLLHARSHAEAPCELQCPNGETAQGPNRCLDCETAIGNVRICC
jgi:hypothetical protein